MAATSSRDSDRGKRKTALILAAVALAFFIAIMLKYGLAK